MRDKFVLVFDIGSSKLRAMYAGRGLNDTFNIKGYKEISYDGFYQGEFIRQEKISLLFEGVIKEFDLEPSKMDKIYIGVPAEFSSVKRTDVTINFGNRRKVKPSDIDSLYYMASEKAKNLNVEVVSVNPISYILDDGRMTLEPVGENAVSITANLSIIYVDRKFIELFNAIVGGLDFDSVEYISEPLSQALFVIPKEKREDLTLLLDVGDLSTSISFVKGEGLYALTSFSRGGGFITNDLAEAFDISMDEADLLKHQIVLSLKGKQSDFYELPTEGGKLAKIPLNAANEVVSYRIDEMAEVISKCVQLNTRERLLYLPIYLTGAGLSKIKGGRDYLAKCLGRNISYGKPPLPGKDKPELSSILSLVNSALISQESKSEWV